MSCNCGCHDNDPLMPKVAVITNIRRDTPDVPQLVTEMKNCKKLLNSLSTLLEDGSTSDLEELKKSIKSVV